MVHTRKYHKNNRNSKKSRRTRRNYTHGGNTTEVNTPRVNMSKSRRHLYNRTKLLGPRIEEVTVMNPAFGANRDKMRNFLGKNMLQQFANPIFNPPTNNTGFNKNPKFRNWLTRKGSRPILTPHPPLKPVQTHAFNPMAVTVVNNPLFKK